MNAIEIPLKLGGIGQVNRQINELGKRLSSLSGKIGGGSGGGGGTSGMWGGSKARTPAFNLTQNQNRMAKFAADLAIARRKGYAGPATESGVYQYNQAQRAMPKVPKTFQQKAMDALMTSRIGAKGGLMPLVNRIVPLLGEMALPLTLVVGGLKTLADVTMQAADNINDFRKAQLTSGGTGIEAARLQGAGRALGLNLNEMSRAFADEISHNGLAAGYASRMGIFDPGGNTFGTLDKAKNFLKFIDGLGRLDPDQRMRALRMTNQEGLAPLFDMSARTRNDIFGQDADRTNRLMTPEAIRAAADFNGELSRMTTAFSNLATVLGTTLLPMVTSAIRGVSFAINTLTDALSRPPWSWILKAAGMAFGAAMGPMGMNWGQGGKLDSTMDANAKATADNTKALEDLIGTLQNGIYGGGARAAGAIPGAWWGGARDANGNNPWSGQSRNLGAFT